MKKIIILCVITTFTLFSCSKDEQGSEIQETQETIKPIFIGKYDKSKKVLTPEVYKVEIDIYGVEKRTKLAPYQFTSNDYLFTGVIELVTIKEKKFLKVTATNTKYFGIVNEKNGVFEIENTYTFSDNLGNQIPVYIGLYNPTVDFSVENKITQIVKLEIPSSSYFVKNAYIESIYTY
jgi:hypothetical protein